MRHHKSRSKKSAAAKQSQIYIGMYLCTVFSCLHKYESNAKSERTARAIYVYAKRNIIITSIIINIGDRETRKSLAEREPPNARSEMWTAIIFWLKPACQPNDKTFLAVVYATALHINLCTSVTANINVRMYSTQCSAC